MSLMNINPNQINATQAFVLRLAGYHQTDNGLLAVPPFYTNRTVSPTVVSDSKERDGMRILRFELLNVAAASPGGIGFRFDSRYLKVGRLSADGLTYTDITDSILNRTPVAVQVTGADQTGFVVGYPEKFGWLSADFTTAETNAGGVSVSDHAVQYSQLGTTWATTTAGASYTDNFTTTNGVWAAGATNFVWSAPADWMPNVSLIGGQLKGYYLLRFTSAEREAADVAAVITGLEVGILDKVKVIAQNGIYENEITSFAHTKADGIVAYFGTADAGNNIQAEWETY